LAALLLAVVGVAALLVGRADFAATPEGGGNPLTWVLAAVALTAAIGALALARRPVGVVLLLASTAALSGWALLRAEALLKPVLPTDLPDAVDRTTIALALGVSIGAAAIAVLTVPRQSPAATSSEL
jgi:hypothetical protein